MKLLLSGVVMPLGKLSHLCALMEVTYHLADAFYYGTGADPLKQHGIKCLAERLDCVRLHLETQQFMCQPYLASNL